MNPHAVMDLGLKPLRPRMRRLSASTMQAWTRLVSGYLKRHPLHQVQVFYHHTRVHDLQQLVMSHPQLDYAGFELRVQSPEGDLQEVPKLLKLMEGATGTQLQHFLTDLDPNSWFLDGPSAGHA